ncbi:16S rRNA (guanine(527)-N(7))-methyltransferase RsmG [Pseudooceanicola onchidii]|uniref:16S rRNA (guanine(527)-N(7))-methyltransferase RsmG n=1 Tax=Pseudooceanicola onchidii TaxID=2562279 RepID=UPI0010A9BB9C|nr:16S rRNA (guanine(527)-N(7))-methyltransferase RsmG [Pseudooceanicola onchidii]
MDISSVSRETNDRLKTYLTLLEKWSPKINLVSAATLASAWDRHFVDSAQLVSLAEVKDAHWLDIGSGGGFPGMVVAIILAENDPSSHVSLLESDQRKCVFLRTVAREVGIKVDVINARIESAPPIGADIISARALSSLSTLLGFAQRHGKNTTTLLFPKGRSWKTEIEDAQREWRFTHSVHPSNTDAEAVILRIEEIEHV